MYQQQGFYQAINDRLLQTNTLQMNKFISSQNQHFYAILEQTGELSIYKSMAWTPENKLWSTGVRSENLPVNCICQDDGNFVMYDSNNTPVWATDTWGQSEGPYQVIMQNDGNLVLYDTYGKPLWASNTCIYQENDSNQNILHRQDRISSVSRMFQGLHLTSKNQYYHAVMQEDGNFVIYFGHEIDKPENAIWASDTNGKGESPFHLAIQEDGNVVVYDKNQKPTWATGTWGKGKGPYELIMQDDANLVLYDSKGKALWASNTCRDPSTITPPVKDLIKSEGILHQNYYICDKSQTYYAVMQTDGNFVLYKSDDFVPSNALWASGTYGKGQGPYHTKIQNDGNLVVYDSFGKPLWASDTYQKGQGPWSLIMQEDGNLVLYDSQGTPTWASDTYQ